MLSCVNRLLLGAARKSVASAKVPTKSSKAAAKQAAATSSSTKKEVANKAAAATTTPPLDSTALPPPSKPQQDKAKVQRAAKVMAAKAANDAIVKTNPVAAGIAQAVSTILPKGADPHRDNVIVIFKKLADSNKALGELHRARAYSRAIQLIGEHAKAHPGVPLTSAEQLKHLKGIGPKLYIRIDEIIRTGTLRELNHMYEDPNMNALLQISAVHGIGPKAALRFHKIHGISTVDQLREKVADGTIVLNAAQTIGLRYHEDIMTKIPFAECQEHGVFLQQQATAHVHADAIATICGSHRRCCPFSGDIDVLLSLPDEYMDNSATSLGAAGLPRKPVPSDSKLFLANYVESLQKCQYLLDSLALGDTKYMGICKLPGHDKARRIDIRWVPAEAYPTALLYFTGSKVFNTRMREFALGRGYSLSEYGLFKLTDITLRSSASFQDQFRVPVKTEKDIFDAIGFNYVIPEQRTA